MFHDTCKAETGNDKAKKRASRVIYFFFEEVHKIPFKSIVNLKKKLSKTASVFPTVFRP